MDTETHKIPEGTISGKSRPPRDVRIVAYLFYIGGFAGVLVSILLCSGLTEPDESHRVLLRAVVLANGLTQGVYTLFMGLCYLFIAWGLMRGVRLGWWFAMIYIVYCSAEGVLQFPGYPVAVTIGIVINISLIAWLWFRRELYGIHLAASRPKK